MLEPIMATVDPNESSNDTWLIEYELNEPLHVIPAPVPRIWFN